MRKHRLLPVTCAALEVSDEVYHNQSQDTFDWARDNAERQLMSVIFVPGLNVEGEDGAEQD